MKNSRVLSIVLLLAMAVPAYCERPNILLIVSEDNGPELGCYGDPYAHTPHLDKLAAEGVRFENAFVPYSVCSPSRAAFLTGLFPHQNGQIGLATHKFAMYEKDTPNFVTLLKSAGYHTGLIGKLHVNPESAFPFDFRAISSANFQRKVTVEAYAQAAARFIRASQGKPFFLSVNFPDAHLPFIKQTDGRPPKPLEARNLKPMPWVGVDSPRIREQVANYYNCLARLDDGISLLLDELKKAKAVENTLVIYIGDHGAQFPRGKGTVYEGGLRVPLLLRWPGHIPPGIVRKELVSTIDLLPTVLSAAGMSAPSQLTGRPLQPLCSKDKTPAWRRYNFGFTTGSFPRACFVQHSIRDEQFKLISSPRPGTDNLDAQTYLDPNHQHFVISGATPDEQAIAPDYVQAAFRRWSHPPRYELYDLKNDPHEWKNLAENPQYAEVRDRLIAALKNWQTQTRDPFVVPAHVNAFVEEQLANRDLAYRKQKGFRWSYLTEFKNWRESRARE